MKKIALAILLLTLCGICSAQTTVNVTVTDTPDGQTWNNGVWSAALQMAPGQPYAGPFVLTGGGSLANQNGSLSSSGTASIVLPANANIKPVNSVWAILVCSQAAPNQCFTNYTTVSTSSPQTLNITPPSIRIFGSINTLGYLDSEISNPQEGSFYWNISNGVYRIYHNGAWQNSGGGGGSGCVPGGSSGNILEDSGSGTCNSVAATGTGSPVKATGPTITLPNATGLPISTGVTGLGTGVLAALEAAASGSGSLCLSSGSSCYTGGTVTTFSASNITGFATQSVSTPTTTPSLSYSLNNTGVGYGVWGNIGSSSGAPSYNAMSSYPAVAFPTLNQNTTGSAASLSIAGQSGLLLFTGLTSTNRTKTVRDANDTILELGGSYTPTGTWNWTSCSCTWPTFNQNTTGNAGTVSTASSSTNSNYSLLMVPNTSGSQEPNTAASFTANPSTGAMNVPGVLTVGSCSGCGGGSLPSGVKGQVPTNSGGSATTYTAQSPTVGIGNGGAAVSLASANYSILCDSATVATGMQDRGTWIFVGTGGSNNVVIPDLSGTGCSGMFGGVANATSGSITVARQTSDTFTIFGPFGATPTTGATSFTLTAGQTATYSPDPTSTVYDIYINQPTSVAGGDLSGTYPNPTVAKINGLAVPASAHVLGSNSSSQPVTATASDIAAITYVVGGGTAQAQTATLSPAITAYTTGLVVRWKPSNANTGAGPTLAVNGLSAITILKEPGNAALIANDLTTTTIAMAIYDGTNFELQNPQTSASGAGTGSCTNQVVTAVNSGSAPTCTTATSAYVDSSVVTDSGNTTTTAAKTAISTTTAGKINYIDFPEHDIIPAAMCNNATAGPGWSIPSSNAPTVACRAGTNNLGGVLQWANNNTTTNAQFTFQLPFDWDTSTQPYWNIIYGSGANTSGTIKWTISSACTKSDGSVTDDPSFVAETTSTGKTMATANRMWAESAQFANITSGNNCIAGSTVIVKITSGNGTATSTVNVEQMTLTVPRLIAVQAD